MPPNANARSQLEPSGPRSKWPVKFEPAGLPGCFEVIPHAVDDLRGRFVKYFHAPSYAASNLESEFPEAFYTTSRRGVIRGMHFQIPPFDHAKIVWCLAGRILDVLLDIRQGSPTYGRHVVLELDESVARGLYIPAGIAHGFLTLTETSILSYLVSRVHPVAHDAGLRWDSFGMNWPETHPIVSMRDSVLPPFPGFVTPFQFNNGPRDG